MPIERKLHYGGKFHTSSYYLFVRLTTELCLAGFKTQSGGPVKVPKRAKFYGVQWCVTEDEKKELLLFTTISRQVYTQYSGRYTTLSDIAGFGAGFEQMIHELAEGLLIESME